jgi:hypothetical protein
MFESKAGANTLYGAPLGWVQPLPVNITLDTDNYFSSLDQASVTDKKMEH